jgi:hypothetical protein
MEWHEIECGVCWLCGGAWCSESLFRLSPIFSAGFSDNNLKHVPAKTVWKEKWAAAQGTKSCCFNQLVSVGRSLCEPAMLMVNAGGSRS